MRAKRTAKTQLTPPKVAADAVRAKLAELGIDEKDVAAAIGWARQPADPPSAPPAAAP